MTTVSFLGKWGGANSTEVDKSEQEPVPQKEVLLIKKNENLDAKYGSYIRVENKFVDDINGLENTFRRFFFFFFSFYQLLHSNVFISQKTV